MTSSRDDGPPAEAADVGLLAPVQAGTAAEALTSDAAVLEALVEVEVSLLEALVDAGVAPAPAAQAADRLRAVSLSPRQLALDAVPGGNPVIPLVPRLRDAAGSSAANWVHLGATSQDVLDSALMVVAQRVVHRWARDLEQLGETLRQLAGRFRDVPAVGRTLSQQALPTTMGLRIATWYSAVRDALVAVQQLRLPVSLAGPVGTSEAYGERAWEVRTALAARLGLAVDPASWHTRRSPVLAVAAAAEAAAACCGTLATDVVVLSQTEVGEVRERHGGPSSSMPHKANPLQSVLILSATRQIPFLAASLGSSAVTGTERPAGAWHAEWAALRSLLRLTGAAVERSTALATDLQFDEVAMRRNLDGLTRRLEKGEDWVRSHTDAAARSVDRALADEGESR